MYKKKLLKGCLVATLAIAMAATSMSPVLSNGAAVVQAAPENEKSVTMNIQFKDGDEVIAGGDYFVPEGVQNYSVLEKYVPEGYQMTTTGDFMAEEGAHLEVSIEKVTKDIILKSGLVHNE